MTQHAKPLPPEQRKRLETGPPVVSGASGVVRGPVREAFHLVSKVAAQLEATMETLAAVERRLQPPTREVVEAMRRAETPVTPEAYVLAVLRAAYRDLESAWSTLEGVDVRKVEELSRAYEEGQLPAMVMGLPEIAKGRGYDILVTGKSRARGQASTPPAARP